jgi:hypothetical protein
MSKCRTGLQFGTTQAESRFANRIRQENKVNGHDPRRLPPTTGLNALTIATLRVGVGHFQAAGLCKSSGRLRGVERHCQAHQRT